MNIPTSGQTRRTLPWRGLAAVVLACAAAVPSAAQVVRIEGVPTNLSSTADRMISYRAQDHMWLTSDGVVHALINRGARSGQRSLVLFSSIDGGATWADSGVSLPSSSGSSTSDGFLVGDRLSITYDARDGAIHYATMQYDSVTKQWSLSTPEVVFRSDAANGLTPAMAADEFGRIWLSFTHQDRATNQFSIKMMLKPSPDVAWTDTGFVFGPVDDLTNERCGRPVVTSKGVGMVYSVREEMFWAERNNFWPTSAAWLGRRIDTKANPLVDPYGCHFSVVTDADWNLHVLSVDGGAVVYSRYLAAEKDWSTRTLTGSVKATYLQATMAQGNLVVISNTYSYLSVFQSSDGGETFVRTHMLTHPAPVNGAVYNRPRVETAAQSTSPITVLQQFEDATGQRALYFKVPVTPVAQTDSTRGR